VISPMAAALRDTLEAEDALIHGLRRTGDRHAVDHDVSATCQVLAERAKERISALGSALERYGGSRPPAPSFDGVLSGPRRAIATARVGDPDAAVGLVEDLRSLYLQAQEVFLDWSLLKQGGMALRDGALVAAVGEHLPEVERVCRWAKTRVKLAAPQVLGARDG
jgi:hypothetical protein